MKAVVLCLLAGTLWTTSALAGTITVEQSSTYADGVTFSENRAITFTVSWLDGAFYLNHGRGSQPSFLRFQAPFQGQGVITGTVMGGIWNTTVRAWDADTLLPIEAPSESHTITVGGVGYVSTAVTFTIGHPSGAMLTMEQVQSLMTQDQSIVIHFDNTNVNPSPEPASVMILGAGGVLALLARRRMAPR